MGGDMVELVSAASVSGDNTYQNYTSIWGIATTSTGGVGSLDIDLNNSISTTTVISYLFLDNVNTSSPVLGIASDGNTTGASSTLDYSGDPLAGSLAFVASNNADYTTNLTIAFSETADDEIVYRDDAPSISSLFGYFAFDSAATDYTNTVAFTGSGGNDRYASAGVILAAIPEPHTSALLAGAMGLGWVMLRRRRSLR